jgi:hypothetical protein
MSPWHWLGYAGYLVQNKPQCLHDLSIDLSSPLYEVKWKLREAFLDMGSEVEFSNHRGQLEVFPQELSLGNLHFEMNHPLTTDIVNKQSFLWSINVI